MFFKIGDVIGLLAIVARTSREFAIAHCSQFPPKREARDRQAELVPDPLRQIDKPSAQASSCLLPMNQKSGTLGIPYVSQNLSSLVDSIRRNRANFKFGSPACDF